MASQSDSATLCRIGPGTPMSDVFRRFWHPVCLSEQIAKPDCDPVRVEFPGVRLVAFRDSVGKLGLVEEGCLHRGVSLALGRNEDEGLRARPQNSSLAQPGRWRGNPRRRGQRQWYRRDS